MILWHSLGSPISGRYGDEEILAEATKVFPNSRVARDFDRIVI